MQSAESEDRSYVFTVKAWNVINATMERDDFFGNEPGIISRTLSACLQPVCFHEYLKRYIYIKTEMIGSHRAVPLETWQNVIVEAFRETGTPPSLRTGSTSLQRAARAWLTQERVARESVLLMGFGLYMTADDVNAFLTKALREEALDPDDPVEGVCLYCYQNRYRFARFQQLTDALNGVRGAKKRCSSEDIAFLSSLSKQDPESGLTPARQRRADVFAALYRESAGFLDDDAIGDTRRTRLGTLERELGLDVPRDRYGNFSTRRRAALLTAYARHRMTRQRLHRILSGQVQPGRYDILTLKFYLSSAQLGHMDDRREALRLFRDETDALLAECGFAPLYACDPYDALLILSMLTADPLSTYSDVREQAFVQTEKGDEW